MIHSIFQTVGVVLHSLPAFIASGGYSILGVIVFLEGLPVVGTLLPGHVAIISAGFLAKLGVFNLFWVIIITIISAALGDIVGFFLGKKYGDSFLRSFFKKMSLKEEHIEKAKAMIDKHTGKAIILGKFTPVTRSLIPFLVGANGLQTGTFWFYNIIGGISWAVSSVLIGYIFGAGYPLVAHFLGKFIVIAIIITILIIWGYRFVNSRFHIFKKYELFVLGLNLVSLWALAKTIQDSLSLDSFMVNFDISANLFIHGIVEKMQWLAHLGSFVSTIGNTLVMIVLGFVIGIRFLIKKKWRRAGIMIFSVGGTALVVSILKELFVRSRPDNAFLILTDPSFPSGHAALAAAFFVSFAYVYIPRLNSWIKREVSIFLCLLAVFAIGLSRIILSVHWASDVIAGWALGIFIATSTILLIRYVVAVIFKGNYPPQVL